jgi:ribosomal protein S12 methylthiotransferase
VRYSERLLDSGVRELNLVAQDLTAYGSDFPGRRGPGSELPALLRRLAALGETRDPFWVRLLYAYPIGVTEELIRLITASPVVSNYLDLPLQHISHSVLKSMRRPLGERGTRGLIEKIREISPEIALRTTFITGFPGETESDVEKLRQFVEEGHFTHVGVFPYSQEGEALSYNFPGQIPEKIREERRAYVMEAQQRQLEKRNESLIGTTIRVLVDGQHEETDLLLTGRAEWQAPETDGAIVLNDVAESFRGEDGDADLSAFTGEFVEVEITESAGYDLIGRIVTYEDSSYSQRRDRQRHAAL